MKNIFRDQVILVTGAAGSVGKELVRQLTAFSPAEIRLLDNNESELFLMAEKYGSHPNIMAYLGDVRDFHKISAVAHGCDIIFHCAAFKHVFFSEYNPFEAVQTNILGTKNVVEASLDKGVKEVIFTSSDKAVNPTSVMGTSKLMGERLITAANIVKQNQNRKQRFSSVRFGNVVGSRGSVFHVFHDQIRRGGPVTVTEPAMTRFIMSLERAAELVLEGAFLAQGGEVLVTKMQVIAIMDLAQVMIALLAPYYGYDPAAIPIEIIGTKPGEKIYEELMSAEEVRRSVELESMYVVLPAFRALYSNIDYHYSGSTGRPVERPYHSGQETPISQEQINKFLIKHRLLPEDLVPAEPACVS